MPGVWRSSGLRRDQGDSRGHSGGAAKWEDLVATWTLSTGRQIGPIPGLPIRLIVGTILGSLSLPSDVQGNRRSWGDAGDPRCRSRACPCLWPAMSVSEVRAARGRTVGPRATYCWIRPCQGDSHSGVGTWNNGDRLTKRRRAGRGPIAVSRHENEGCDSDRRALPAAPHPGRAPSIADPPPGRPGPSPAMRRSNTPCEF